MVPAEYRALRAKGLYDRSGISSARWRGILPAKQTCIPPVGSCIEDLHFREVLGRLTDNTPNGEEQGLVRISQPRGLYAEVSEKHSLILDACMRALCPVRVLYT